MRMFIAQLCLTEMCMTLNLCVYTLVYECYQSHKFIVLNVIVHNLIASCTYFTIQKLILCNCKPCRDQVFRDIIYIFTYSDSHIHIQRYGHKTVFFNMASRDYIDSVVFFTSVNFSQLYEFLLFTQINTSVGSMF